MNIQIELESLDDLINLIGLFRTIQKENNPQQKIDTESKRKEVDHYLRNLQQEKRMKFLSQSIEALKLWRAAENSLKDRDVFKIEHLLNMSAHELKKTPSVGLLTIKTIREKLAEHNCYLKGDR